MAAIRVGSVTLDECAACGGVFVDPPSFERICAEREQQAVVLRASFPAPAVRPPPLDRYWPCPSCGRLMNRQNFARLSGVIVDVCKGHGVWFNHGELQAIVEFIRAGGLERAREREKEDVRDAIARRHDEERAQAMRGAMAGPGAYADTGASPDYGGMLSAARDLLKSLFE
jgi:Zn-finger nucleic acid-binding protein